MREIAVTILIIPVGLVRFDYYLEFLFVGSYFLPGTDDDVIRLNNSEKFTFSKRISVLGNHPVDIS